MMTKTYYHFVLKFNSKYKTVVKKFYFKNYTLTILLNILSFFFYYYFIFTNETELNTSKKVEKIKS